MEATKAWWEREVERARAFFESDNWQTDDIGGNRPTLREVSLCLTTSKRWHEATSEFHAILYQSLSHHTRHRGT